MTRRYHRMVKKQRRNTPIIMHDELFISDKTITDNYDEDDMLTRLSVDQNDHKSRWRQHRSFLYLKAIYEDFLKTTNGKIAVTVALVLLLGGTLAGIVSSAVSKPTVKMSTCNGKECPTWQTEEWSRCSVTCGIGYKQRLYLLC